MLLLIDKEQIIKAAKVEFEASENKHFVLGNDKPVLIALNTNWRVKKSF